MAGSGWCLPPRYGVRQHATALRLTFHSAGSLIIGTGSPRKARFMITTTLKVNTIHCENCEEAIRSALSDVPGVAAVVPSAERSDVQISFDDGKLAEAQLKALLRDAGFQPVS